MAKILLLGLDDSGKTTVLYQLKYGENTATHSTDTFNRETLYYAGGDFEVWDLSGRKPRNCWSDLFPNTQGVIFVVDSSDKERICEAKQELSILEANDRLSDAAFLVLANKQDLLNAMNTAELTDKLGLNSLIDRNWHIQAASAVTGDGITEGMDWLVSKLQHKN